MLVAMYCPDCQTDLTDTPVDDPCPKCRGVRRSAAPIPGAIKGTSHLPSTRVITESNFPDGGKEIVVGSVDFISTTHRSQSGELVHEFSGEPVRGERDVLQVCESLQEALRRRGVTIAGKFRTPPGREGGIDAEGHTVDGAVVRVQVTGVIDQATMAQLGRDGRTSSQQDVVRLANDICNAIVRKVASYPAFQRNEVLLALDAIRSPGHASSAVAEELRKRSCKEVLGSSGYQAVWLVGPKADLTYLLDE
jgi:hypothetical protein